MPIAIVQQRWSGGSYSSKPLLRDIVWTDEKYYGKELAHNTYRLETLEGKPCVRFHSTIIVTLESEGVYRLNSGGYQTSTTKQRINALLWDTGISVYQRDFEWFVSTSRGDISFTDNMKVATF